MHQRYGWQLIENEPDFKSFCLKSKLDPDQDIWITLSHNNENLFLSFNSKIYLKNQFSYLNFYDKIKQKLKFCWKILFNKKLEFEYEFEFSGRNQIEDFSDIILLLSKEVKQETNELIQLKQELRRLKK